MASKKKAHVPMNQVDNTQVLERKLRPVYDCLDYGNYKKALQECEKVLKKHSDSTCALALKALSLIRLGRVDEGKSLVKQVHETRPSDESTLQVLTICYKELNFNEPIADLYEHAVQQQPDNEEYLTHLFMGHVRLGNYKKQHQVAVKLHKLKPDNNPYYYWGIMSLILQATEADEKLSQMLLTLAEKMARTKRQNLTELEKNAETTLLCTILQRQGRFNDCLETLHGEMGNHLMIDDIFKETRIAELHNDCGRIDKSNAAYKNLILKRPDDWSFYVKYMSTSFKLIDASYEPAEDRPDCTYTTESLIEFLEENYQNNLQLEKQQRGPLLGLLELYSSLYSRGYNSDTCLKKMKEILCMYCKCFGHKACCYTDSSKYFKKLMPFLPVDELLRLIWSALSLDPDMNDDMSVYYYKNMIDLQKHIFYNQVQMLCDSMKTLSIEEKLEKSRNLRLRFLEASSSVEKDVVSTDVRVSDSYLLLAVHILIDAYIETKEDKFCLQSLAWLEQGLKISPSNHQFSILLIYVYCSIGAYGPVPVLTTQMDVKQILYDPIGYMYSVEGGACCHFSASYLSFDHMLKFFTGADREIAEGLIQCYRYGTFSKVEEFGNYQRQTAHSMQYALAQAEKNFLDLIFDSKSYSALAQIVTQMESVPVENPVPREHLRDNRDIPLATSWKKDEYTTEMRDLTFQEQKYWLEMRRLTVRIIATALYMAEGSSNGTSKLPDLMNQLFNEYKDHYETMWSKFILPAVPLFTSLPTRLVSQIKHRSCDMFIALTNFLLSMMTAINAEPSEANNVELTAGYKGLCDHVDKVLSALDDTKLSPDMSDFSQITPYIRLLSDLTEIVSLCVIYAGIYWKFYEPLRMAANSRKKKRGASANNPIVPQCLIKSNGGLKQFIHKLKAAVATLVNKSSVVSEMRIANRLQTLELPSEKDEFLSTVEKKIDLSYDITTREVTELLNSKKQFLEGLTAVH